VYASFASQKASDPRSNIFALLGLVMPDALGGIRPDYLVGVASTYINATVRIIDAQGQIPILRFAGLSRGTSGFHSTRRLPSWVPDFSQASVADVWSTCTVFKAAPAPMLEPITFSYTPCHHLSVTLHFEKTFSSATAIDDPYDTGSDMLGCVSVSGAVVDVVDVVGEWPKILGQFGQIMSAERNMYEVFTEAHRRCYEVLPPANGSTSAYPGLGISADELCWRLLIADLDGDAKADAIFETDTHVIAMACRGRIA